MIPPPRNALLSHYYYKKHDVDRLTHLRFIADSGAYTAKTQGVTITNKQLALWTKTHQHRLCWVACLDVPSLEKTRRNWLVLVNDHQLEAVPTIHFGDHPSSVDWYAEQGVDLMGLGGMAGASCTQSGMFKWLAQVFKYAKDNHPQMRFHGWGMTKMDNLRLPFWSVDSSGWGGAYRYGKILLRDPRSNADVTVALDGKSVYKNPAAMELLRDVYEVSPSDVAKAGPPNRNLLVKISAMSAAVYEQRVRYMHRNHPVTPPKWGRLAGWNFDEQPGPHIHLVDGYFPFMRILSDMAKDYDEGRLPV